MQVATHTKHHQNLFIVMVMTTTKCMQPYDPQNPSRQHTWWRWILAQALLELRSIDASRLNPTSDSICVHFNICISSCAVYVSKKTSYDWEVEC